MSGRKWEAGEIRCHCHHKRSEHPFLNCRYKSCPCITYRPAMEWRREEWRKRGLPA